MQLSLQTGTENEILRKISVPVRQITKDIRNFAKDMVKAMDREGGVGLAAPQVGRNIRLIICKLNPGEKNEVIVPMVNPELVEISEECEEGEEGCLSLPEVWGKVVRPTFITLKYQTLKGESRILELDHFNARIVQHEIDHLNGILFTDDAVGVQPEEKGEEHLQI